MKPICTIYWIEDDDEKKINLHDSGEVSRFSKSLEEHNVVHWVCWTSMTAELVNTRRNHAS